MSFDVNTTLHYKKSISTVAELPEKIVEGDVYYVVNTATTYVGISNRWTIIDTTYNNNYQPKVEYTKTKPKICKCCGAPLRFFKCEYCGVEYD